MTLSDLDLENRLRDQRARAVEIPPVPSDLAQRVRDRAREQRRNRMALTAAGIAAALVFVGLPALASGVLTDGSRGESAAPSTRFRTPAPSHLDLPTRGSLAGDEEWVAGVRALSWLPEDVDSYPPDAALTLPDPAVEERKVVFAGDVPDGRVALVMARTDRELVQAWFTGPRGARAADMRLAVLPANGPRLQPLALLTEPDPATDRVALVVVAGPGDAADVLTGREVAASGATREIVEPVPLEDGVGAMAVDGNVAFPSPIEVRIRIADQRTPAFAGLQYDDALVAAAQDPVEVADPRGLRPGVDEAELQWSVQMLLAHYGLPAEQLRPTLLVGGSVEPGSRTSVLLVGVTFPSGATTAQLSTYWRAVATEGGTTTSTSLDPAPAGAALLDRLIAVATSTTVTISGPSTGVEAQFYAADGTLVTTVPLVDGAGIGPLLPPSATPAPRLATVRVLDGQGAVVAESPVEQER